jgi:lactoylglutathione lyase
MAKQWQILHTMIRVTNLDKSIDFYTRLLGMTLRARRDYPDGRFTLAFLGYGEGADRVEIELTHNWDTNSYELGTGYGHVALGVSDIYEACDVLAKEGAKITRPPGPMKHGSTVIAFIEDPDGYKIVLIQTK